MRYQAGLLIGLILFLSAGSALAASALRYAQSDLSVLYIYESPEFVDWPVLYYLNEQYGADITLLSLKRGLSFWQKQSGTAGNMNAFESRIPQPSLPYADSLLASLQGTYLPDIVLYQSSLTILKPEELLQAFGRQRKTTLGKPTRHFVEISEAPPNAGQIISINRIQWAREYQNRISLETPLLNPVFRNESDIFGPVARYLLISRSNEDTFRDFFENFNTVRLDDAIQTLPENEGVKQALVRRTLSIVEHLSKADSTRGTARANATLSAYKEANLLRNQLGAVKGEPVTPLLTYADTWIGELKTAVIEEVGLDFRGTVSLRETPAGTVAKYSLALTNAGPISIDISKIFFHHPTTANPVVIDSTALEVAPYQSFVKDYTVPLADKDLEQAGDSLRFSSELIFGQHSFVLDSYHTFADNHRLSVHLVPDFQFVAPVERIDVDKTVRALHWRALITKPANFRGKVRLNLETPTGVYAGAYRQEVVLDGGRLSELVEIPFSVSNLFQLGTQPTIVSITQNNRVVQADTGRIRIAECRIPASRAIAFIPDSAGLLEDILRITDAQWTALTERSLLTADLSAYSVIVIGPNASRYVSSLNLMSGQFDAYLRGGGSLVLFAQPEEISQTVLPVNCELTKRPVKTADLRTRLAQAKVLSQPYAISEKILYSDLPPVTRLTCAKLSPVEVVIEGPESLAILSVSRLGEGQLIYCGLPLLELISELNIEAIHLFANLMNY